MGETQRAKHDVIARPMVLPTIPPAAVPGDEAVGVWGGRGMPKVS